METLGPAIAEIAIGLAFCFFGYPGARFVLALWGAVLGFILGVAGYAVVVGWLGSNLGTIAPWIAGAIGAVILILFWTVEKNLPEEQKAIKERSKK